MYIQSSECQTDGLRSEKTVIGVQLWRRFFYITHTDCYSYIQVSITKLTITLVVDEILSWKGKDLTRTSDILR